MNFTKRRIGAIALIVAGIGAFLVPFLLHSPTPQGTSTNSNGGGTTKTTTPNPTTSPTTTPGTRGEHGSGGAETGDDSSSECNDSASHNSKGSDDTGDSDKSQKDHQIGSINGKGDQHGNAFGLLKNKMDITISQVKAMSSHNNAFEDHHSTDTDNHTVHGHTHTPDSDDSESSGSACTETETEDD